MNKFFEFHDYLDRQNNRPYHRGIWEPLKMEAFRLLPFQIPANGSDYTLYQVIDDVETDITSYMNGVTITSDYILYDGSTLDGMITNDYCHFKIDNGGDLYYSEDCDIGCVNSVDKFTGNATDTGKSFVMAQSYTMDSEPFNVNKGDTVTAYLDCDITNASDYDVTLSCGSAVTMTGTQTGTVWSFEAVAPLSRSATVQITGNTVLTTTVSNYDIEYGYSDKCITLEVSSTVDYGTVKYATGWTQKWYKRANVRRSPSPQTTIIAKEPNGILIKEKSITSNKYKCNFKVTESEFDALNTAQSGTVTITDQTGKVFTCNNIEMNEPTWNQGNGIVEFTFVDNISVYTLNNSVL